MQKRVKQIDFQNVIFLWFKAPFKTSQYYVVYFGFAQFSKLSSGDNNPHAVPVGFSNEPSLKYMCLEVIHVILYQTQERVFHQDIQTREVG